MDHNLKNIDFEDPFDGSLLNDSIQEKIGELFACGISDASFP